MMLSLDTAYHSFGGEVEASSTPTICRLSDSRRHQLPAIAPPALAPEYAQIHGTQRRAAIAGLFVFLIALALVRIRRISSVLKAFVSRCRVFFGTETEQSANGFIAISRCLTAHFPTALRAVTQTLITVNALRF